MHSIELLKVVTSCRKCCAGIMVMSMSFINFNRFKEDSHGNTVTESAIVAYNVSKDLLIPNVQKLLQLLCVLPITSCEAERSFSRLKFLKTNLRSTMKSER